MKELDQAFLGYTQDQACRSFFTRDEIFASFISARLCPWKVRHATGTHGKPFQVSFSQVEDIALRARKIVLQWMTSEE